MKKVVYQVCHDLMTITSDCHYRDSAPQLDDDTTHKSTEKHLVEESISVSHIQMIDRLIDRWTNVALIQCT